MKLTSKQLLERIIKEEVSSAIGEPESEPKSKVQDFFENAIKGSNSASPLADEVGVIGKMWDEIIAHAKLPPKEQIQWIKDLKAKTAEVPWHGSYNNFVTYYFRKALEEVKSGLLDPNNAISGEQMEKEQRVVRQARKDALAKKKEEEKAKSLAMPPDEKARAEAQAERWAMYGGDPEKRPWGLGS